MRWLCNRAHFAFVMFNGTFFVSSCSDTRAMGRVLDVRILRLIVTHKGKGEGDIAVEYSVCDPSRVSIKTSQCEEMFH